MKIILVTNISLNSEKFKTQNKLLFDTAKKLSIELTTFNNMDLINFIGEKNCYPKCDAVLFYDKDIFLAESMEENGYKVFNCSECIKNCDNKALTYKILQKSNIKIPKTFILPLTYFYNEEYLKQFIKKTSIELGFPMVAKKFYGSEGKEVFLINNKDEMAKLLKTEQGKELLFQKYYKECHGRDIRINVVGNEVVASIIRENTNGDFRSNLSNGGVAKNYIPTKEECDLAVEVSKALGCDFCGVDILQTNSGPVVCEVNSNAHLLNIYNVTKINVAEIILNYIKKNIK